jgi:hypothetical protein
MVTDTNFANIVCEKGRLGGSKLVSVTIFNQALKLVW